MIKKNFLYKSSLENKLSSIGAGLFVVCLCLLSGSCDSDSFPGDDDGSNTDPVALHFSTSVEKLSSTADTRAIKPGGTVETEFPKGSSDIGMFITRNSTAGSEVFPGSDKNMKAVLTRSNISGIADKWEYTYIPNGSSTPIETKPEGHVGKSIQVVAYWPYDAAATASGIPFDFKAVGGEGVTELLYNKQGSQKIKIVAGQPPIQLNFAHAYSRIILTIKKTVTSDGTTPVDITSASVANQSGSWIKNEGKIDPATGYPTQDSKPGDIIDSTNKLIAANGTTYDFLVPAFMDEKVADGDVIFKLLIDGKETTFELRRDHLNDLEENGITKYGFRQGYKNTYQLEYDNNVMSLRLRNWTVVKPEGNIGVPGVSDPNYKGWMFDKIAIEKTGVSLPTEKDGKPIWVSDHRYEGYLSDQDRENNGSYLAFWQLKNTSLQNFTYVWNTEPPCDSIEFAIRDVLLTSAQWRDQGGILVAKELCKNYREGGYSNWRLPRMSEWYMFERRIKKDIDYLYYPQKFDGGEIPGNNWYWSGTESTLASQQVGPEVIKLTVSLNDIDIEGSILSYDGRAMVRCVRDVYPIKKE